MNNNGDSSSMRSPDAMNNTIHNNFNRDQGYRSNTNSTASFKKRPNTKAHHAMNNKKILPNSKLKSEYFADCLSKLLGVDVSRFDIYNDKKKKGFTPHQIPNSMARDSLAERSKAVV